ncbi:MAG: hypothetical protein K8T10_13945 [Candidatus Eremiobacteraeota bacterium]|nr:hypothetical protein [Candidatus Eremiobacteraeota bacterium]
MNKKNLLIQLTNIRHNFALIMAACRLFSVDTCYEFLDDSWLESESGRPCFHIRNLSPDLKEHENWLDNLKKSNIECLIRFHEVSTLLRNDNDRKLQLLEFAKMGVRALIKESFEVILTYCEQTGQKNSFTNQTWYHFYRLLRNAVSHDFKFSFKPNSDYLPAEFKDHRITSNMNNSDVTFSYNVFVDLFKEAINFVEVNLV